MAITKRRRFKTELSKARGRLAKAKGQKDSGLLKIWQDKLNVLVRQLKIQQERPERRKALDEKAVLDAAMAPAQPPTRPGKSHGGL
ncbi:hypothetical protein [Paracidovorax wautersii]|uniref:Uncharacterized protein n=1 Tax=Paracidovorax wautersii TaxID=1177982 RepID=A0A1I2HVN5_9BURK|nr:hypothetical protein [Paracidovorax wautersii]SFF34074.1 hypothetical protein SAMN04489711_1402 [Paracidovorax wautersii]